MPRNDLEYSVDLPSGIESFRGINVAWLRYATGNETSHDGYGNAFNDYYFNGTGANTDIQNQLNLLKNCGYKTIRIWLNIYHQMNADKATVGYTAFREEFLRNLSTYCDWCFARGIKMLICLDDSWYTFPWEWLSDSAKRASYVQACKDVVTALKNKPAVWGWDYCNEPYMGWAWLNTESTIHHHNNIDNDLGYTRAFLTDFFKELYVTLKPIVPHHLFSVGHNYPSGRGSKDLLHWDVQGAVDFYQVHTYVKSPSDFSWKVSEFEKPVIIGEFGWGGSGGNFNRKEFIESMYHRFFQLGYGLIMPWSFSQGIIRDGNGNYSGNPAFLSTKLWQG